MPAPQHTEYFRVVAVEKGRLRPKEFRLRPGEKGLSVFALVGRPAPADVLEAVRAAGKQGDLRAAVLRADQLRALGLRLVKTEGGTAEPKVNAIHYDVRLSFLHRMRAFLRGEATHEYFREQLSMRLCGLARLLD